MRTRLTELGGPVLITGGTGMLGAELATQLCQLGQRVRVLVHCKDHPRLKDLPIERVHGDVTDPAALRLALAGCRQVFHAAGLVSYADRDRDRLYQINVQGTVNVLAAARHAGVARLVHVSSTAAVGLSTEPAAALDEDAPWDPEWAAIPYMDSKRRGELAAQQAAADGQQVVLANPTTLVGKGDINGHFGAIATAAIAGRLRWAPPGGTSVVGVADAARGLLLAMAHGQPGRRYILSTCSLPIAQLLQTLSRLAGQGQAGGKTLPRWLGPMLPRLIRLSGLGGGSLSWQVLHFSWRYRYFSASRAKAELHWQPQQTLEQMLAEHLSELSR